MKKFVENTTRSPMYVGNTMIPPGEGKLVDVPDEAPATPAAAPAGPSLVDLVAALLGRPIKAVLPDLPGLTHEALELAEAAELAGQKRKTLLDAISAERMRRADAKLQADEAQRAADALALAELALVQASNALEALAADAPEADREAATQAVDAAQAKVDALAAKD